MIDGSSQGNVQKSPSSKAAVFLVSGAYFQYVSTVKRRERRWRLFSTFPRKTNLPGGYQLHEVGPNSKGGQLTISSHLFSRQFTPIAHHCQTKTTPRFPFLSSPTFVIGDPSWPSSFPTFSSGNHLLELSEFYGVSSPYAEALLFRQKDPKPCRPWRGPSGSPVRFADSGGAQIRQAQTVCTFSPESAALLGHATRPGSLGFR